MADPETNKKNPIESDESFLLPPEQINIEQEVERVAEANAAKKGLKHFKASELRKREGTEEKMAKRAKEAMETRAEEVLENMWHEYGGKKGKYKTLNALKNKVKKKIKDLQKGGFEIDEPAFCDLMNEGYRMDEVEIEKDKKGKIKGIYIEAEGQPGVMKLDKAGALFLKAKKDMETTGKNDAKAELNDLIISAKEKWEAEKREATKQVIKNTPAKTAKEPETAPEAVVEPAVESKEKSVIEEMEQVLLGAIKNYENIPSHREYQKGEVEYLQRLKKYLENIRSEKFSEPVEDGGRSESVYQWLVGARNLAKMYADRDRKEHGDESSNYHSNEYKKYKKFTDYIESLRPDLKPKEEPQIEEPELVVEKLPAVEEAHEEPEESLELGEDDIMPISDELQESAQEIPQTENIEEPKTVKAEEKTEDPDEVLNKWLREELTKHGCTATEYLGKIERGELVFDEDADVTNEMNFLRQKVAEEEERKMEGEISEREIEIEEQIAFIKQGVKIKWKDRFWRDRNGDFEACVLEGLGFVRRNIIKAEFNLLRLTNLFRKKNK